MPTKTHDARHVEQQDDGSFIVVCECDWESDPHPEARAADADWRAHYDELTPAAKRFDADLPKEPTDDAT